MASILNRLFERYRTKNGKLTVNPKAVEAGIKEFGENAVENNPNIEIFNQAQNNIAQIIDRRSVVTQFQPKDDYVVNPGLFNSVFTNIDAIPIQTNKTERIRQYRAMAQYTECDFCLTELADDMLHENESGDFIVLDIPEESRYLNDDKRKVLQAEFRRFIELFRMRDEAYTMVKRFLTDGELCYENIINANKPELGIIGIKYLPTEYYETILNNDTGRPIGILFDKEKLQKDIRTIVSTSCLGARAIFNSMITTQANSAFTDIKDQIPLLYPQLTYISSGETSPDGLISYPLIEKCKQAYHQLALMQDAAVILRVTRAPERLLFNIDVGGMPEKVARQKIQEVINKLKSKKIVSSDPVRNGPNGIAPMGPEVTQVYDPVSMLESYFFGKTSANDGTTITSVGSTADYEQIADIEFFLRRLFKQFKVPFSRYKNPENSLERDETISYEEYSMARAVMRIQRRFAMGLKRSFITDLKLIGLWKTYNLKDSDINIRFILPVLYDLYQTQKLVTAKMDTYKAVVDQEELSKINAMKKILRMTDEEIEQNFMNLIKEKQLVAIADYFADKISDDNKPLDYKSPIRLSGEEKENSEETEGGEGKPGEGPEREERGPFGGEEPEKEEPGGEEENPPEGGEGGSPF